MSAKAKPAAGDEPSRPRLVKAPVLGDATNRPPSFLTASRRRQAAVQPASGTALRARHDVAPKNQA